MPINRKKKIEKEPVNVVEEIKEEKVKAFSEFEIDPSLIEELDNLPQEDVIEVPPVELDKNLDESNIIDVVEKKEEEFQLQKIDLNSLEYSKIIRDNIQFCSNEIKDISSSMDNIEKQKGGESFWKKTENIKTISRYVSRVSDVQQKTLDLIVLLLGASGKMVDDYDMIMKTIDELGELNNGESEVLNYLLKVKKMLKEIKDNDQRLKDIMSKNDFLEKKILLFENNLNHFKEEFRLKYDEETAKQKSRNKRLESKINRNSFYTLILYVVMAAAIFLLYIMVF